MVNLIFSSFFVLILTLSLSEVSPPVKISIFSICFRSHLRPLLTLAQELSNRSNVDVTFIINGECEQYVREFGLNMQLVSIPSEVDYIDFPEDILGMGIHFGKIERPMLDYYVKKWENPENRPDILVNDFCTQAGIELAELFAIPEVVFFPNLRGYIAGADANVQASYTAFMTVYEVYGPFDSSFLRTFWHLGTSIGYAICNRLVTYERNKIRAEYGLGPISSLSDRGLEKPYMAFVEEFFGLADPRLLPPYIELVGPMPLDIPMKPNTDDIVQWIQDTEKNFIYVAFGTLLDFTPEQIEVFQEVIRGSSYNFLIVSKIFPSGMKNAKVVHFTNQIEVLQSPKILAFVSHGGQGSLIEAIKNLVPIICLPRGRDHFYNGNRIEDLGIGKMIKPNDLTTSSLSSTLDEVVRNSKEEKSAEKRLNVVMSTYKGAKRVADMVVMFAQTGYEHLVPKWYDFPWYQRNDVDIIMIIVLTSICVIGTVLYLGLKVGKKIKFEKMIMDLR